MFIQRRGRKKPQRLVLDIDPTDDPCHGRQQLALFNGFYGQYMYLPNLVFERHTGMLLGLRLRGDNVDAAHHVVQVLKPIVAALREAWPEVEILIRADGEVRNEIRGYAKREASAVAPGQAADPTPPWRRG